MKKILKYNLEIMTGILLVFCAATVLLWHDAPLTRKLAAGFMLIYILHEWEECRFPGGFHKLFFGRIGAVPKTDVEIMHIPVAIALLVILIFPWLFHSVKAFGAGLPVSV